jgi:CRP-like cAMP-binding protein
VKEGEPGDALYLVVEGRFIVLKAAQEGGLVPLDWIGPGGFFGEMALFDRGPRSATVISENQGLLLKLDGQSFTSLMERVPTIPIRVCAELSKRIRTVHGILLGQKAHQ